MESARGLRRLHDILTASERVGSASFQGARGGDLVRDLGATWSLEGRELLFVRSLVVFEARAAGIEQIFDGVFVDLDDDAGFEADTEAGRRLGYTGRVAIHPRQVAIVNRVHTPTPEAVDAARELIAAFREAERDGVGAIRHRGRLVDYAMVRDAEQLLARAGADDMSALPLEGIRVIDAGQVVAGPFVAQLLGDFGADVIKIEPPQGGDPGRLYGPAKDGVPLLWVFHGRNKKSVTLDLRDPRGADVLRRLCAQADVLIQSFRPQTVERYGLGYEQLAQVNERLVVVYVTGFGLTGPYAERPGFGTLVEAMSGFAHITGEADGPPTLPQFALADSVAALYGAFGVMNALYWRDALGGGRGQYIDLSLLEPLFSILGAHATMYDQLGIVAQRTGSRIFANAPRNVYRASDGKWLAIAASVQQAARRCFDAIGRPGALRRPALLDGEGAGRERRRGRRDRRRLGRARRTRDEALAILLEHEVPAAPVLDIADFLADPHVEAREVAPAVDDPDLGPVRMQGVVPLLSRTPGRIARTGPRLGEHNDEVYRGLLGMADEELAELRGAGVV